MDLTNIHISTLHKMLKLSERKEELLKDLKELEEQIFSHLPHRPNLIPSKLQIPKKQTHTTSQKSSQTPEPAGSSKRASRGSMKTMILEVLQQSGPAGIKVPEIARQIGVKNANVHVWLSNTGKKLAEIERIGAGLFRIRQ